MRTGDEGLLPRDAKDGVKENETTETWREYRRAQQQRRAARLPERQDDIRALKGKGFSVLEMNDGYQFRIDGALDLYPIHRRFHVLATGRRGTYRSAVEIAIVVLRAQRKPEKRLAVERKEKRRARMRTRAQVVAWVWMNRRGLCERCGKKCKKPVETYPTDPDRGEVNDIVPRSLGGDPLDVKNQEFVCFACHHGGKSGAHAPTPERMEKR